MAERDDDPLALLAAEWRRLAPPDPTAAVDAPDEATRATVEWLRAAWQASAPATSVLPWTIRLRAARRTCLPWVAAAAAILLAVALLLPSNRGARSLSSGDRIVDLPAAVAPVAVAPVAVAPVAVESPARDAIPLVAVDARRMEMRRGPVRLILVTPSPLVQNTPHHAEPGSAKEPK
jgi:hypothetical protein